MNGRTFSQNRRKLRKNYQEALYFLFVGFFSVLSSHVMTLTFLLQTLLRVWDCFLLEGPKVLFRFSLAILKLHEREIVNKTETISVMRHLKACARVTYDVEGLVQVSGGLSASQRPSQ